MCGYTHIHAYINTHIPRPPHTNTCMQTSTELKTNFLNNIIILLSHTSKVLTGDIDNKHSMYSFIIE